MCTMAHGILGATDSTAVRLGLGFLLLLPPGSPLHPDWDSLLSWAPRALTVALSQPCCDCRFTHYLPCLAGHPMRTGIC